MRRKWFLFFFLIPYFLIFLFPTVFGAEFNIDRTVSKELFSSLGETADVTTTINHIGETSAMVLYREKFDSSVELVNSVIFQLNGEKTVSDSKSYSSFLFKEALNLSPKDTFIVEYTVKITNPRYNNITFGEIELIEKVDGEVITYASPQEVFQYTGEIIITEEKKEEVKPKKTKPLTIFGLSISQEKTFNLQRIIISIFIIFIGYMFIKYVILKEKKYEKSAGNIDLNIFKAPEQGDYEGLKKYVYQQMLNKTPPFKIKQKLIGKGWSEDVVNAFIK